VNGQDDPNLVLLAIATREGRNGATLPALDYPRALQENGVLFP